MTDSEPMTRMGPESPSDGARTDVSFARCEAYEAATVRASLESALAAFGGMGAFVQPGERIGIKPNLLMAAEPEQAITTHPLLVRAVVDLVRETGAEPVFIESTGAGMPQRQAIMDRILRKTGMRAVIEETGCLTEVDGEHEEVSFPQAELAVRLDLLSAANRIDGLINLPKLKTHTFMTFTGAVKNLFGFVPGLQKAGYHAKLDDPRLFADMLLDIYLYLESRLTVMDAVIGLEGDGPGTGGDPVPLGFLLAGTDEVLVDRAACRAAGIPEGRVPTLERAVERGLAPEDPELAAAFDGMAGWPEHHIVLPKPAADSTGLNRTGRIQRLLMQFANDTLNVRPRPNASRCTGCGVCRRACPVGAIEITGRLARVADDICIRCYCCHEFCPEGAVDLEMSRRGRVAQALGLM